MTEIRGEVDHCRHRLNKYCQGQGLDIGCGRSRINLNAIGIDLYHPEADMKIDARLLTLYPSNYFDFIFSSHLLEEIENTEATLKEWLRVVKKGGDIVLYQADKNTYYPLGDPRCNRAHKHHFSWEDLWEIFKKIGGTELIHSAPPQGKEWSFELVVQKKNDSAKIESENTEGISFLIPTLKRPHNMEQFTLSLEQTVKNPSDIEILFGIHSDDELSIKKAEELKNKCKIQIRCEIIERYPDNKIHLSFLWNQLYARSKYPILGYFGDDVIFKTPAWDEEVRKEFSRDKAIMVYCNDVHVQKGAIATLFFTHKSVHEKVGFYLKQEFRRWYMDTYWDNIYRRAGKIRYREDIYAEHMHPDKFPERADEVYKNMEMFKSDDGRLISSSAEIQKEMLTIIDLLKNFSG